MGAGRANKVNKNPDPGHFGPRTQGPIAHGPGAFPNKGPNRGPQGPLTGGKGPGLFPDKTGLGGEPDVLETIGSSTIASIDGRSDRPTPLSRWYATVESITGNIATVVLDDDSNGASTITIPCENVTPTVGQRVVAEFREDGLAVVTSAYT